MHAPTKQEGIMIGMAASVGIIMSGIGIFYGLRLRKKRTVYFKEEEELFVRSRVSEYTTSDGKDDSSKIPHCNSTGKMVPLVHPEGPNIGYGSGASWLNSGAVEEELELPVKTDLLHKGHNKGGKLLLCMVGLPGRGKTYIARKVARYLRWINYRCRVFSVARTRLEVLGEKQPAAFFDPTNQVNNEQRMQILMKTVENVMNYLGRGGEVAILDGSNFERARREAIRQRVAQEDGYEVIWIESLSDVELVIESATHMMKDSPDFIEVNDFKRRVDYYRGHYESLDPDEGQWVKVINQGSRLEINHFYGFLPTKITSYVMNLHIVPCAIYLSRHGESEFNERGLIGGDSALSKEGELYAEKLTEFIAKQKELPEHDLLVWTSTMRRTRQTAKSIRCARKVQWRALREIEVGVCDGLTYEQIKELFPDEYRAREQDKLRYRYPRGESYIDLISRLEPVLFEIERNTDPLLIVAHQAVLRCLYAYFLDLPTEEIPFLSIPLHTVIRLTPQAFGCSEKRYKLMPSFDHSGHAY